MQAGSFNHIFISGLYADTMRKVAVVQLRASTDKEANLEKIIAYIRDAAKRGASLCAFPEFMMFYTPSTQSPAELARLAEPVTGTFVQEIARAAKESSIEVVGTLYEKGESKKQVFDTAFLMDSSGRLVSKYRKVHLYDALGFRESKKLAAGSQIPGPQASRIGKIGMMICYDLRFPEMSRKLAAAGTEVLVAPSAWVRGKMKEEHWIAINRTRAIENGCFVISPDQVGNIYCGRSLVIDPYGRILLDMKKRRGLAVVGIDGSQVGRVRRALPLLENRRTDLYADLS